MTRPKLDTNPAVETSYHRTLRRRERMIAAFLATPVVFFIGWLAGRIIAAL